MKDDKIFQSKFSFVEEINGKIYRTDEISSYWRRSRRVEIKGV